MADENNNNTDAGTHANDAPTPAAPDTPGDFVPATPFEHVGTPVASTPAPAATTPANDFVPATPFDHADTPAASTPAPAATPGTPANGASVPGTPAPGANGAARPPSAPAARRAAESVVAAAGVSQPATPFVAGTPPAMTPNTPGTQGTPATPSSRRRELGASQVRLTPAPSTPLPQTPGTPLTEGDGERLVLWGTNINYDDTNERLTKFIEQFKLNDEEALYLQVLQNLADTGGCVLNIDMTHLYRFDKHMYRTVVSFPSELITVFDAVVSSVFEKRFPEEGAAIAERRRSALHVRTYNLRPHHVQSMRNLNPSDIAAMVAVRGMVIRASALIPDIQRAMYRCNKCKRMQEEPLQDGRIAEPRSCPSCRARDSFSLIHSRSAFADKQMVRLQEAPESVPKGETPATFTLIMYDSLVDCSKPGDRVEITGILRASPVRLNPKKRTVRSVFRTYIDCVHVRILNNNQARTGPIKGNGADATEPTDVGSQAEPCGDELTQDQISARNQRFDAMASDPGLYERLANSLAPSIFGMTDEKKGVLLQLFGGASKAGTGQANDTVTVDGSVRFRSAINILLVGDPGTSKSQLLHCAHRLAPRGVYTSGRGSSAVGLTAYVTRDPDTDEFVLESGALVLSDRGVCCIDEFDKMSDFARSVLHEAMEQQTVSIAKAGIIATLNARTAVLAAANPVHSRYDTSKSVVDNIDLPPTLLSRFDLIYLVLDAPNADADRRLAQHIVSLFYKNYDATEDTKDVGDTAVASIDADFNDLPVAPNYDSGELLDSRELTAYIAYARAKVDPVLSEDASTALVDGYLEMRGGGRGGSNITATPRQLESLIRLAEALARMQLRNDVLEVDVAEAMRLVKAAMHMAAYDPNTGKIDMNLFAMGQSRAAQVKVDALAKIVLEKIADLRKEGARDVATVELLSALRKDSDVDIAPGDVREALRRLEQDETVSMTKGGTHVRVL